VGRAIPRRKAKTGSVSSRSRLGLPQALRTLLGRQNSPRALRSHAHAPCTAGQSRQTDMRWGRRPPLAPFYGGCRIPLSQRGGFRTTGPPSPRHPSRPSRRAARPAPFLLGVQNSPSNAGAVAPAVQSNADASLRPSSLRPNRYQRHLFPRRRHMPKCSIGKSQRRPAV
jgi:hypothetical protein